jgi:hypothetical protein
VERGLPARRPVARKIEHKCQNSFHDTYLLLCYGLPRRSDGRSRNTRLIASRCDRLLGPSSMARHHPLPLPNKKNRRCSSQADSLRNSCAIPRAFSPHCRALALHNVEVRVASAALDSALIRRDLVTRWGLSTFPGSGISSCRRLT